MTSITDKIGLAEAAALERRKQLLERKKKLENKAKGIETEEQDSQTRENQEENSQPTSNDNLNDESQSETIENQDAEEKLARPSIIDEELDLNELAPRKIDWDLKRDIESKLQVLQERTEIAIAELVRDDLVDDIDL